MARGVVQGVVEGVASTFVPGPEGQPPLVKLPGWAWGLVALAFVVALVASCGLTRWWRRWALVLFDVVSTNRRERGGGCVEKGNWLILFV